LLPVVRGHSMKQATLSGKSYWYDGAQRMITKTSNDLYRTSWAQILAFLAIPVYLYVNLFAFPNIPIYLDGDQIAFWENAIRMLDGELIYRDYFQFTPEGTNLYFLGLFKLFGTHIWVMNFAALVLGIALCWVCFSIAKLLMERKMALLTTCLFLVLIYGKILDATHHWFGLLGSLCAMRIVMPARTLPRVAAAGAIFAVASCFTQTSGVVGVLVLFLALLWEAFLNRRTWRSALIASALLVAVFGVVLAAFNAHLFAQMAWQRIWYFQVTYPHRYMAFKHEGLFQGFVSWRDLRDPARRCFLPALLLVIYFRELWGCWRKRREARVDDLTPIVLLSLLGLFLLLIIITRANWTRIYANSMPGLILWMRVLSQNKKVRAPLVVTSLIILACMATKQTWVRHRDSPRIADLPAGRVALSEEKYEKFSWLAQHTKPGDFLFQQRWFNVYPALELRSPAWVDALWTSEATRPESVDLTLQQLESRKPKYILITPGMDIPDDPDKPWQNHLGPFLAYLKNNYVYVRSFADQDEVWKRQ
jgi:hypothetical protein